jgi:integrase
MRITDTWLRTAKPRKARYDVTTELRGLMVRVHPSGALSFRYRYKRGKDAQGRPLQHLIVLGEYGRRGSGLTLEDAHDFQRRAQRWFALGLDPIEEKRKEDEAKAKALQERADAGTVAELVDEFVHRKLRAERWDAEQAAWVRDAKVKIKPRRRPEAADALLKSNLVATKLDDKKVGDMKACDLTRRQLVRLLDGIVDRGAPITANRVHALLRQLFDWAAAKDLVPASPMAGIERPGGDEAPRKRVLTSEEIQKFWAKVEDADAEMSAPTRLALKLLLVTGQRRGELTFAKWSHFDLESKLWTIPVELLKSSHSRSSKPDPHMVPLSPLALEILEQLKTLTGKGTFVLPAHGDKTKDRSYSERVLSRAVRDNEAHFGIPHFTPHDLRRTAASFMTKLGVPRLHVEKVLNHSTSDIAEIYDRHDYLPEKKVALEKWAAHLQEIITGKDRKVVPMQRAG